MNQEREASELEKLTRLLGEHKEQICSTLREELLQRFDDAESEMAFAQDQIALLKKQIEKLEARMDMQIPARVEINRKPTEDLRNAAPYTLAIQMAKKGFSKQEIVNACKITDSEAELVMALHNRTQDKTAQSIAAS